MKLPIYINDLLTARTVEWERLEFRAGWNPKILREIEKGRDFFAWNEQVDWIVGNPPYKQFRKLIRKSQEISGEFSQCRS